MVEENAMQSDQIVSLEHVAIYNSPLALAFHGRLRDLVLGAAARRSSASNCNALCLLVLSILRSLVPFCGDHMRVRSWSRKRNKGRISSQEHERASVGGEYNLRKRRFPSSDGYPVFPPCRFLTPGKEQVLFDGDAIEREPRRTDAANRFNDVSPPDRTCDSNQRMSITKAYQEEAQAA